MWQSDDEDDAGIRFFPTDEELIKDYLMPKIENKPCGDYIVHKDVYGKEPWLLDHYNKDNFFLDNEWFYFVTRTQVSELKTDHGKNSKRKINGDNDDRGNWKSIGKKVYIKDEKTGKVIGIKQHLTFNKSDNNNNNNDNDNNKNKKKQKLGDNKSTCAPTGPGSESSWNMEEYMLVDEEDKFQKLVLCKIKKKKNNSNNKDEDITDGEDLVQEDYNEPVQASSSQQQQQINDVSGFIEAGDEFIKDDQVHTNAPLGYYSSLLTHEEKGNIGEFHDQVHTNSLQKQGEGKDWFQEFFDLPWTVQEPFPASSSQQQPINDVSGLMEAEYEFDFAIEQLIGQKKDDQVHTNPLQRQEGEGKDWLQDFFDKPWTVEEPFPASSSQQQPIILIEDEDESLEQLIGPKKDDQVHTNAPLGHLHTQEANQGQGWINDFASALC